MRCFPQSAGPNFLVAQILRIRAFIRRWFGGVDLLAFLHNAIIRGFDLQDFLDGGRAPAARI